MKIPPHFPHPTSLRHQRNIKRAMKDFPNGTGYGTIVILLEVLASQPELKYPIEDIDILSDEIGISIPIIQTIISKYEIFKLIKDKKGESFFSISLNRWMEPYYKKIEENRIKGIKSGLARKKKIEKEIKELKLIQINSSEPQLNRSSTNRIEEKRIKEKKELLEEKKVESKSSCSSSDFFKNWIEEKSKNAKNQLAYKATLLQKYKEGEKSVIKEFASWQKQKETEKLIFFRNKKIMLDKGEIYEILGVENKDNRLHVYLNRQYQKSWKIANRT